MDIGVVLPSATPTLVKMTIGDYWKEPTELNVQRNGYTALIKFFANQNTVTINKDDQQIFHYWFPSVDADVTSRDWFTLDTYFISTVRMDSKAVLKLPSLISRKPVRCKCGKPPSRSVTVMGHAGEEYAYCAKCRVSFFLGEFLT